MFLPALEAQVEMRYGSIPWFPLDKKLLIVSREDRWAQYGFPKGRVEYTDQEFLEDPQTCARRETFEEIGFAHNTIGLELHFTQFQDTIRTPSGKLVKLLGAELVTDLALPEFISFFEEEKPRYVRLVSIDEAQLWLKAEYLDSLNAFIHFDPYFFN